MSYNTIRNVALEVLTDLKQVFDDKEIQLSQVVYWVLALGDRIKSQHILKRDSGAFLTVFDNIPLVVAATSQNPNIIAGRKYFELPSSIYDFDNDRGIEYVAYVSDGSPECPPRFTRTTFSRTKPKIADRLYYGPYETPSPKNPYFYRVSDKVYTLGLEKVEINSVEIGIYMTFDPITMVDIDKPFDFPAELIPVLQRQILDLGRFVLMVPSDWKNDGSEQSEGQVPTQKLVSVQPQNQQEG